MCLEELKSEFRLEKFGCCHKLPHVFVLSQFRSRLIYPVWVTIWAIYHIFWLFVMEPYILWKEGKLTYGQWSIYLTNWGYVMLTIGSVTDMVATLYAHKSRKDIVDGSNDILPWYLKVVWIIFNVSNTVGLMISIGYFSSMAIDFSADSVATHIVNSIYVILNLIVSSKPVQILHFYQPMIFVSIYGFFNTIYQVCGGVSVYSQLDISDLLKAAITAFLILCIGVPAIHLAVFGIYKLKVFVIKYCQMKFINGLSDPNENELKA